MGRLMLLEQGEELSAGNADLVAASSAPLRLKLIGPLAPFRNADVLRVGPALDHAGGGRQLFLCRAGADFVLSRTRPISRHVQVIGGVNGVERAGAVLETGHGVGRLIDARFWPAAIAVLASLRRLRHPLTPPLFQGRPDAILAGVRAKYDAPVEAIQYGGFATTELDAIEREIVAANVAPGGRILDVGCGGGREAVGLARAGFRVVGIDIAPRMIEIARRRARELGFDIEFRVQSVTALEEPSGSFDAAVSAGSLHHVPGRDLRVATLRRLADALAPSGVLLLMVIERDRRPLLSRSRLVDVARTVGRALGAGRLLSEPGDTYMREVSEGSDPQQPCFFHYYPGPAQVRAELEAGGFVPRPARGGWWICRRRSLCHR